MRIISFFFLFPILSIQAVDLDQASQEIVQTGVFLNQARLCPATAGNFSSRIDSGLIAMTVSGKHKGELTIEDIVVVDLEGKVQRGDKKPSAETELHTMLYNLFPEVGAVLHTHSTPSVVISRLLAPATVFVTEGYEIHKVFPGIRTHDSRVETPIFENSQNITQLAKEISAYLSAHPNVYGFLLRGHGFYTWGRNIQDAKNRIEAFEHLFESEVLLHTK